MTPKTRARPEKGTRDKPAVKKASGKKASSKKATAKKTTTKKTTSRKTAPKNASGEPGTAKKTSVRMTAAPESPRPGAVTATRVTVKDQTAGVELGNWSQAPSQGVTPRSGDSRVGWDNLVGNRIRPLIRALKSPAAPGSDGVLPMGAWVLAIFASGFVVGCLVAWVL